jgi:hypothetical protein
MLSLTRFQPVLLKLSRQCSNLEQFERKVTMPHMSETSSPFLGGTPRRIFRDRVSELRASRETHPYTYTFVQLLNAWDEYEVGVLKALFHYRPPGHTLGPDQQRTVEYADELFTQDRTEPYPETPRSLMYAIPALTDWLRYATWNPDERQATFAEIFDIESRHGATDQERLRFESQRKDYCDKRKAILDEQTDVQSVFYDLDRVNLFVEVAVPHLAEQCRVKHMLIV